MALPNFSSSSDSTPREFSRLIGLKGWSYEKAREMKVIIVGCGGLGNPIARLITRLGIGNLVLIDNDIVEIENLNRDGFEVCDIGKNKAEILKRKLEKIFENHSVRIEAIPKNVLEIDLQEIVEEANLVVTATDNTSSRIYVNDICVETNTTMIDTGFTTDGLRGHVRLIIPGKTACLRCSYFELPVLDKTNLSDKVDLSMKTGYAVSPAPTLSFLASLAAMIAFNVLFEISKPPNYISVNLAEMKFSTANLKRNPRCEICSALDES
ncbi:HesA/MoeB/ThiF family protein [Archaeoglobus profundus]|uniref:UBA/THIF-type NAD/FAD binding protein n=1 Tax=Archaeoglobus profundus (strain DSM 5631 / JCM 9629 / NBRC 100127 / Av18) TaxID=572546 RepID=D2RH98_ARCPA|nr:ThiF family adenylyltransferase [Archaeoglobus profundus]ADB57673.1 UBA/THIF-type NAD/FAD binding protein [Archaeoglobus profundus DSM 5631]